MLVVGHERQFDWHRAVGKNDVLSLNDDGILAFTYLNGLCVLEFCPSCDEFCSGVLEQVLDTFVESGDDVFFPANQVGHVEFGRSRDGNSHVAVFLCVLGKVMEPVGCVNHSFRRNASSNEACTSCSLTFNDDG